MTEFSPAIVHNQSMQGHRDRTCTGCDATFSVWKVSKIRQCKPCHEKSGEEWCRRCAGTGNYITQVCNDIPVGPGGICYQCEGKGHLTPDDRRRNEYYWTHKVINL